MGYKVWRTTTTTIFAFKFETEILWERAAKEKGEASSKLIKNIVFSSVRDNKV